MIALSPFAWASRSLSGVVGAGGMGAIEATPFVSRSVTGFTAGVATVRDEHLVRQHLNGWLDSSPVSALRASNKRPQHTQQEPVENFGAKLVGLEAHGEMRALVKFKPKESLLERLKNLAALVPILKVFFKS
jgi:hypothetical protein